MGFPEQHNDYEDRLRDLRNRLRAVADTIERCRTTTGRLVMNDRARVALWLDRAGEEAGSDPLLGRYEAECAVSDHRPRRTLRASSSTDSYLFVRTNLKRV